MNLAFGAQRLQPGDEHLTYFFFGEELPDFGGNFGERNLGSA
jgi:hypothetical protein